jgi:ribosomal protein L11 methyltransferase
VPLFVGDWAICGEHEADADIGELFRIVLAPHPRVYGFGDMVETREHLQAITDKVNPGDRVADVGSGTGILAIAAARVGAEVVAFEEVAEYRELIERNIELNGLDIELHDRWPEDWDGSTFDYVLANVGDTPLADEVGQMGGEVIGHGEAS